MKPVKCPVLEILRQYTLREYAAVLAMALLGAAGSCSC